MFAEANILLLKRKSCFTVLVNKYKKKQSNGSNHQTQDKIHWQDLYWPQKQRLLVILLKRLMRKWKECRNKCKKCKKIIAESFKREGCDNNKMYVLKWWQ